MWTTRNLWGRFGIMAVALMLGQAAWAMSSIQPTPIEPTGNVAGIVAKTSGEPIPGALVELLDARGRKLSRTETKADGSFRFERVPAGDYILRATYGGASAKQECHVSANRSSIHKIVIKG